MWGSAYRSGLDLNKKDSGLGFRIACFEKKSIVPKCLTIKGGSWSYNSMDCCSAYRYFINLNFRNVNQGFRIACSAPKSIFSKCLKTKGGSWCYFSKGCRSTYCSFCSPNHEDDSLGFRIACSIAPEPPTMKGGSWAFERQYCRSADSFGGVALQATIMVFVWPVLLRNLSFLNGQEMKGGSCSDPLWVCCIDYCLRYNQVHGAKNLGFRVVCCV